MKLINVKQVSELIGVQPLTIYRWAKVGKIPHIRIGNGSLRFDIGDIQNWINQYRF